jgi:DnaJ-class molecular chaperone
MSKPCNSCGGAGGRTTTTTETVGGRTVTRQQWSTCGTCRGSGTR